MTLEASGTLTDGANVPYVCMLVRGKAVYQLEIFSVEVVSTTTEHLNLINLGLGTYFFPVNALSKKKRAMRRGMRKP